ncbi:MAG: UDP-3-O-(3-hydroxymyristoyl)glucosamine N-acyltransferase [candidate division WOR-3 bacterium]
MTPPRAESRQPTAAELSYIHPTAKISPSAEIAPLVYIGPEVEIGAETIVAPLVTIFARVKIGARVRIGPGTVIGWEGFGYEAKDGFYHRIEHTGWVIIEDDVEIGPNVTIAQAKTGRETRLGQGTKIDALTHIAHNVNIGKNCIIVAQSGVAGSSVIGDGVRIAGQCGVKDHITIGAGSILYAKSALFRSIPPGSRYWGIPARPINQMQRFWARIWQQFAR